MHNKKTWILVLVLVVSIGFLAFFKMPAKAEETSVPINEETFKDEDFRTYVKETFDEDKNNVLDAEELEKVTKIEMDGMSVYSLEGIAYFKNLTSLSVTNCGLETLDLSQNTALTDVNVLDNYLTSLNVQGLSNLVVLTCNTNYLAELDVGGLTKLNTLDCSKNYIKSLDLSETPVLCSLDCFDNYISSLDLQYTPNLSDLTCYSNYISSLDISSCPNLIKAYHGQSYDTTLDERYDVTVYEDGEFRLIVGQWEDIIVLDPPTITVQPSDKTVTVGDSAGFNVVVDGENLEYTWQVSKDNGETWTDVNAAKYPSAKTPMLTFKSTATLNGYLYHCVVSNSAGSVTSSSAKLTVNTVAKPTITTQPSNKTVELGKSVTFKVTASGSNLTYQWQYKKVGGTWTTWKGKTSASLKVTGSATNNGCQYRCIVKNAGGSTTSKAATLTVTQPLVIETHPLTIYVLKGKKASFSVTVSGTDVTYTWQVSKDGGATWKSISKTTYPSAATATLEFTAKDTMNAYQYRCVVTDGSTSAASDAAILYVTKHIASQPAACVVLDKENASFTVKTDSSHSHVFCWQVSKDGGKTWKSISQTTYPSAATNKLTFKAKLTMDGYMYRCKITNASNASDYEYTKAVKLVVYDPSQLVYE